MAATQFVALDVSTLIFEPESAEVEALKARVKAVAKKYTDRHGWCDEVGAALREIGVDGDRNIEVVVTLAEPFPPLTVRISASDLHEKTAAQQAKALLSAATQEVVVYTGSSNHTLTKKQVIDLIAGLSLAPQPVMPAADPINSWRVLSQGKIAHLFTDFDKRTADEYYVYSACGSHGELGEDTKEPVGTTRKCVRCERKDV